MTKPSCPECGGPLGVTVHFGFTRTYNLVLSSKGEWQAGDQVLQSNQRYPDRDDAADQKAVCLSHSCGYIGPDACTLDSPSKIKGES